MLNRFTFEALIIGYGTHFIHKRSMQTTESVAWFYITDTASSIVFNLYTFGQVVIRPDILIGCKFQAVEENTAIKMMDSISDIDRIMKITWQLCSN